MFFKIVVLKAIALESLFNKVGCNLRPVTLIKRDCKTGVFLLILRNFKNSFAKRTLPVAAAEDSDSCLLQRLKARIARVSVNIK